MKNKIKKLPGSLVELEVHLDEAEFRPYVDSAFNAEAATINLKGFRPGMAPKEMVAGAVSQEKVFRAAINEAVKMSLDEVKRENDWTFIDQPRIEVTDNEKGVSYTAKLTLFPEVKLGNYQKIAKKIFGEKKPAVISEAEVEKTLKWLLESRAQVLRAVRPAKKGDLVEVDIEVESEGKPVPNTSFKNEKFVLGESHFIKGFDEQLETHKEGDAFEFSITAPADYWQKEMQGKSLDFKVKLHGVFDRAIPELNDAFAAGLGPQFKTVAELKANINEGLRLEKEEKETEKLRIKALDAIAKDAEMDIPNILIERMLDSMVADMGRMMPPNASTSPEALAKELREKLAGRAKDSVAGNLVLYKLAQVEKVEPSEDELIKAAQAERVDLAKEYNYIYGRVQNQKVFALLEKFAKAEN